MSADYRCVVVDPPWPQKRGGALTPDETSDCYDCGRQWADCTCEGPQS